VESFDDSPDVTQGKISRERVLGIEHIRAHAHDSSLPGNRRDHCLMVTSAYEHRSKNSFVSEIFIQRNIPFLVQRCHFCTRSDSE
jgi:hypothetical protein